IYFALARLECKIYFALARLECKIYFASAGLIKIDNDPFFLYERLNHRRVGSVFLLPTINFLSLFHLYERLNLRRVGSVFLCRPH
ncbi:MAG: hypothetical protein DRR16_24120, partial [Candidatus Parabeggiatoa sp. nov. 3]